MPSTLGPETAIDLPVPGDDRPFHRTECKDVYRFESGTLEHDGLNPSPVTRSPGPALSGLAQLGRIEGIVCSHWLLQGLARRSR
jgi:hypothetical protein